MLVRIFSFHLSPSVWAKLTISQLKLHFLRNAVTLLDIHFYAKGWMRDTLMFILLQSVHCTTHTASRPFVFSVNETAFPVHMSRRFCGSAIRKVRLSLRNLYMSFPPPSCNEQPVPHLVAVYPKSKWIRYFTKNTATSTIGNTSVSETSFRKFFQYNLFSLLMLTCPIDPIKLSYKIPEYVNSLFTSCLRLPFPAYSKFNVVIKACSEASCLWLRECCSHTKTFLHVALCHLSFITPWA